MDSNNQPSFKNEKNTGLKLFLLVVVIGFVLVKCIGKKDSNSPANTLDYSNENAQSNQHQTPTDVYEKYKPAIQRKLTPEERRDSIKLAKHQIKVQKIMNKFNCSESDAERLLNNKVWIGMTYEMLLHLRGKPNNVNVSNYGSGNEYQACWYDYTPSCFYFNENQIIRAYN